ncbi:transposase [Occultella aeris]|uniref:transposase n=1 Tax=Occultella aeris TaxID=2761496 RepID=UPI0038CDAE1D
MRGNFHQGFVGLLQGWSTLHLWDQLPLQGCRCAQEVLLEFKRDIVRVARRGDLSPGEVATEFDISVESVGRWVRQADLDDGATGGQTSSRLNELIQLRLDKRRLDLENGILHRAAAYFAAGSLPK